MTRTNKVLLVILVVMLISFHDESEKSQSPSQKPDCGEVTSQTFKEVK